MAPTQTDKYTTKEQRISESERILAKYPQHIPVIVECDKKIGQLEKSKFLVPSDVNASMLLFTIRKQLVKGPNAKEAIFLFVGNTIVCPTMMMSTLYENYLNSKNRKDQSKFLYVQITTENTFGSHLTM